MENAEKKGMSKGCLVALIIVGALVVMVIIGGFLVYYYKADIASFGADTQVMEIKKRIADNPPDGVDTVQFNVLADAFANRLKTDEQPRLEELAALMQDLLAIAGDDQLEADEATDVATKMIDYYPDLEELWPDAPDDLMPSEDDTSGSDDTLSND